MNGLIALLTLSCIFAASAAGANPPAADDASARRADYRSIEWGVALYDAEDPAEALERLEISAKAGNPHALFLLGAVALAAEDCAGAAQRLQQAHEAGHLQAGGALGHHQCRDRPLADYAEPGRPKITTASLERRRRALRSRDARYPTRFHYEMGKLLDGEFGLAYGASAEAVRWLRLAAKEDQVVAQVLLGTLLAVKSEDPSGKVPHDPKEAEYWLRKAASTGNGGALYALARMLHFEAIPVRDPDEALRLMIDLAKRDESALPPHLVGKILASRGEDRKAEGWFRLAIKRKHPEATYSLALLLVDSSPDRRREGLELLHQEAARGNDHAQFTLGAMYEFGRYVDRDYQRACRLYRDAAEAGNPSGINNLANCYETGNGAPQDYQKAYQLYELAVRKGSAFALFSIGFMHEKGHGFPASAEIAMQYYERAAALGVEKAAERLEQLHATPAGLAP